MKKVCTVPPDGWYCTREVGHPGPCAAHVAVTEVVCDIINNGEIPTDAIGFMQWFQTHIDKIPADYLATTTVDLYARYIYEDPYVGVEIRYTRPETEGERLERETQENKSVEARQESRYNLYRKLKREFDPCCYCKGTGCVGERETCMVCDGDGINPQL
jgi:hypothetical protein